jgi:putative RecB family exonuclease
LSSGQKCSTDPARLRLLPPLSALSRVATSAARWSQPHVSFTQIDQYLRCPLKYRFTYVDRLEPGFVPAALAFGSGIHGAAAFLFRGRTEGIPPSLADVQAYFEGYWNLETGNRPIRFGEKDTKASLLDLACRMLDLLHRNQEPGTEIVGVEQPFDVPLIDLDTGEVLDRGWSARSI